MLQYQAGYILGSLKELIATIDKNCEQYPQVIGLLNSLSTFDVNGPDERFNGTVHPVLAVVNNIITRGLPTLTSEEVELAFVESLQLTESKNIFGSIKFPFTSELTKSQLLAEAITAMHLIDPRAENGVEFLNLTDTDSEFERNFLLSYILQGKGYLTQLFQHQRSRGTIARNNNHGRVDLSLEVPYFRVDNRQNRYLQQVQVKCRSCFVVEIDGEAYHQDLIDDLKDFELAQLPNNIKHITQGAAHDDTELLLSCLASDPYIQVVEQNYWNPAILTKRTTSLTLSPFLIARIQKSLIEYLIRRQASLFESQIIRLAIVERDIPAAHLAIADFVKMLNTLNELAGSPLVVPTFEISVFSSQEFINNPLHLGREVGLLEDCCPEEFDLVLDVSILRRSGIFSDDNRFQTDHTWVIRSSHFTHHMTANPVYCSSGIVYREVSREIENELHEDIPEAKELLCYFLRNIFRKNDFREGQLPILNRALQLKSVIGLLPTGGGKSLTYQLAAILQPGITIVIDPIRSLMVDQYRGLRDIGIDRCEFINSTLSTAERRFNQNKALPDGNLQFVFVSPERFVIQEFRDALSTTATNHFFFSYVVIDEVHCVSEWGHDFRTPYLNLGAHGVEFCRTFNGQTIPLFGLTATASFDVLADIERELQIPNDDGNSVIRYENTVRDEINYAVKEIDINATGIANFAKENIRRLIGGAKQLAIFGQLNTKEQALQNFNTEEVICRIADYSWQNFVSPGYKNRMSTQFGERAKDEYISTQLSALKIEQQAFAPIDLMNQYNYGVVVFTPHRKGALGILHGGLLDNEMIQNTDNGAEYEGDRFGYFMGSGDDEMSAKIDEESFRNLDEFIKNRLSVMVATKAFGMGIDKPNVRLTIHMNMPQSIESFVQEAGRAGRDKKLSNSLILFNQQIFPIQDGHRMIEGYHLDRDVLMYFHRNSFKGQIKERAMIHELRTQVTYPNITNAQRIGQLLEDLYGNAQSHFVIQRGANRWAGCLFVKATEELTVGYINLNNRSITLYNNYADLETRTHIMNIVLGELPQGIYDPDEIGTWLRQLLVNTRQETGIEIMLGNMQIGESASLQIPFTNKYYSAPPRPMQPYKLNPAYTELLKTTQTYQRLIQERHITEGNFLRELSISNQNGDTFEEFIDRMQLENTEIIGLLKNVTNIDRLHICYYKGRSQEDTSKAIYRLISIGVIDAYTIDYQNKLYTVHFTKKAPKEYFNALEQLMARYTSSRAANTRIQELSKDFVILEQENRATVLSFCLEMLTNFIYEKVREKRLQAIDDMLSLCRTAIAINDPQDQNEFLKDEIFYYFNAKYSRRGYTEPSTGDEASLIDDRESNLAIRQTIEKYIPLVEDERTGQLLNNIKHLRGSTMRMIRSYGEEPAYLILKSFSLLVLSTVIPALSREAKQELIKGMIKWRQQEQDFNPVQFIAWFRSKIASHVYDHIVEEVFTDIEDLYYTGYYLAWTRKFITDKF